MKTKICYSVALFFLSSQGHAQPVAASPSPNPTPLTWQDGARDGWSTEKLATQYVANAATGMVTTNLHRYFQVGSGLNFLDSSNHWQPSQDLIELQPDGSAAATHGSAKAYFSQNLNTYGAISLVSQSNRVFQTHLLGLYFYNAADGSRRLISGMKDCAAQLLPPNQIVWRSAFQSIQADVRFTYTKSAVESDVIILQKMQPPDAYGMSSTNGTVRLEVWHEFINPATPQVRPRVLSSVTDPTLRSTMVEPDLIDDTLDFGDFWFPLGRIYFMDEYLNTPTNAAAQIRIADTSDPKEVPVAKRWAVSQDGSRTYLIESVPWLTVKPQFDLLPPAGQGAKLESPKERMSAKMFKAPPKRPSGTKTRPIQVASGPYQPRGVCLDYITVSGSGDYTFSTGNTYYLASNGYFSGALAFQPNAILKFASGVYLLGYGTFSFSTETNSAPTLFTSKDEDLYGDPISGISTGIPTYAASQAVWVYYPSSSVTVSEVRIRWAQRGIEFDGVGGEVDNSSLEQCQTGLYGNGSSTIFINNSTQCGVTTALNSPDYFSGSLTDICNGLDSNGLPYAWENQYFGQSGVDPNADADGDGLNNYQEYLLGTNPTKASVADTNGVVRLSVYTPLK